MTLILALLIGPSIVLGLLGYYDEAATAFVISFTAGFVLIYAFTKMDEWDGMLDLSPKRQLLLLVFLFLYLGYKWSAMGWKELFDLF